MDKIGTAVISNTHIREVGKLIFADDYRSEDEERTKLLKKSSTTQEARFCDLFSFLDCLILNDKLYTLPATYKTPKNTLWDRLLAENIVETLDIGPFSEHIGKMILEHIDLVDNFTKVAGSGPDLGKTPIKKDPIFSRIRTFYSCKTKHSNKSKRFGAMDDDLRFTDPYDFNIGNATLDILYSNTFEDMARQLVGWLDYSGSGAYEACTSFLRDMYYIFSAEILGVAYYPQSSRARFAEKFPNYYDLKFKTKLYSKISDALGETITNVYDDLAEKVAFIPPFASIILNRSNSREDILMVALELRDEFAKTRKGFNDLERERAETTNLKERIKISKRQRQLFERASRSFDNINKIDIRSVIKYIPNFVGPMITPSSLTNYISALLDLTIEQIIEWWRQRPIQKISSIKDRILEINEYDSLLSKFFEVNKKSHMVMPFSRYR